MATRFVCLAILSIAIASQLHNTLAETLVVGDSLGWLVPPGGPIAYATWAAVNTFIVGDVLLFNFTTGEQDVAMVTKEAFLTCNSTNPISLKTTGPANFTLDTVGEYYFIGTMDRHCALGQKLAINVTAPGPESSPAPYHPPEWHHRPRGPVTYFVGDGLGWLVPPGGAIAYKTWAYGKTFLVGDSLVFNFVNGTQDVAEVTKDVYNSCNFTSTINIWSAPPVNITLNTTGEHFFTSTYPNHCSLGQQLAINVTSNTSSPPTSAAVPPSSSTSRSSTEGPTAGGPVPPPVSSAPSQVVAGLFVTLFAIFIALF